MKHIRANISQGEKLWSLLAGLIVLLLVIYIVTLNFAVSEAFQRGEVEKKLKILRQDFQESEEFFTQRLAGFYDQYSEAFNEGDISKQEFVSRNQSVAVSNQLNIR